MRTAKLLNLNGQSIMEMALRTPPVGYADVGAFDEAIQKAAMKKASPLLREHLQNLNIEAKLLLIETTEDLNKFEVDFLSLDVKRAICEGLDQFTDVLSEGLRIYLALYYINALTQSAKGYISTYFQRRADQLRTGAKSIIITPDKL